MQFDAAIRGNLVEHMAAELKATEVGVTAAMNATSKRVKEILRRQTRAAGLGNRLPNAWRSAVYPGGSRTSLKAAAMVWTQAPKIIESFDRGGEIRSQNGFWLAIPTENAPKTGVGGRKRINPSNWPNHRYGRLRMIYRRPPATSLLVVDGVKFNKSGSVSRQLKNQGRTKTGKLRKGVTTVPMFILVPRVMMPKHFNLAQTRRQASQLLARAMITEMERASRGIKP